SEVLMAQKPDYAKWDQRVENMEKETSEHKGDVKSKQDMDDAKLIITNDILKREIFILEVLKALPATLLAVDRDYNILMVGGEIIRSFKNSDQLLGQKCYMVFQKRDTPCTWCKIPTVIKNGVIINETTTPDDPREKLTKKPLNVYLRPLWDNDGAIIGAIEMGTDISQIRKADEDRQRAVEALSESEEKYRSLVEMSKDGILIAQDGVIKFANKSYAKMLGYELEELLGLEFIKTIPPENRDTIWEGYKRSIAGEDFPGIHETSLLKKSGEKIFVEVSTGLIQFEGKPANLSFVRDITERKREEKKFKENEGLYKIISEQAMMGLLIVKNQKVVFANQAYAEITGYSVDELFSWQPGEIFKIIHPKDREFMIEQEKLKENNEPDHISQYHCHLVRPNGELRYVELYSKPIPYADEYANFVVLNDITDQKQAELKYEKIVQNAVDGYFFMNTKGAFLDCNDSYLNMIGYSRKELLTMSSADIDAKESAVETAKHCNLIVEKGYDRFETLQRRKDGSIINVEVSVQYLDFDGGRFFGFIRDISKEVQARKEKAALEAQLQQAQKMEAVGRLAGGVAHDFNNLLTIIIGNISMAQMDLDMNHPLYKTLKEINSASKQAADLTRQLLAFSRKQIIKPMVINLNKLIKNMHKMLVRVIGEDINLQTKPMKGLGLTKVDPGQIEQCIVNLAINAKDAMPKGGTLIIETAEVNLDEEYTKNHPEVKPGTYIMLAISDTGEGMDEEMQRKIFDPFFTTKEKEKGTGLGLAMVYGIVKQHHGHINVYSEVGEGTTFKLYFPLVREKAEPIVPIPDLEELPTGTETILVVEDEAMVENIAIRILNRLGYKVLHSHHGEDAIHLAKKHEGPIHLLLTDIIMPVMNGREVANKIQQDRQEMKVLYTSGYPEDIISQQGIIEEDAAFIDKPYSPQTLALKVRQTLDG
ncbi:MAG: PAS domain S-box protein, partial [Deltaproteobacteria bacterium]|nr:PAS domain S-box protein [Deltaproteobacteria bacterium]